MANFWKECFSEKGIGSSKRVIGTIIIFVCLGCLIWLVVREGGTDTVKDIIQTMIIVASALLGISSITSIWKDRGNNSKKEKKNDGDDC